MFGRELEEFQKKAMENTDKTIRGIKLSLFKAVIYDTPVLSGRLRGNWQTSTGSPKRGLVQRRFGPKAFSEAAQKAGGLGDVTYLTNNLPYAEKIENGRSSKAPEGMLRRNFAKIQRIVQAEARKNNR